MEHLRVKHVVGSISTLVGDIQFGVTLGPVSKPSVEIYVHTPKDLRRSGVSVCLTESDYESLKQLIEHIDTVIAELRDAGQMTKMGIPYFSNNMSVTEIQAGYVGDDYGKLTFMIRVFKDTTGYLSVMASKPYDRRLAGASAALGQQTYNTMKRMLAAIDALIYRYKFPANESDRALRTHLVIEAPKSLPTAYIVLGLALAMLAIVIYVIFIANS